MSTHEETLGDDVLAAFERACREGNLQVAEYLLQALEAMEGDMADDERVERAYLQVAGSPGKGFHH